MPNEKYLLLRSSVNFTPVYRHGWEFVGVNPVLPQAVLPAVHGRSVLAS